jgi:hypothetical protein
MSNYDTPPEVEVELLRKELADAKNTLAAIRTEVETVYAKLLPLAIQDGYHIAEIAATVNEAAYRLNQVLTLLDANKENKS